jgi:Mn2+/Fe2+ NRAMP family transporter
MIQIGIFYLLPFILIFILFGKLGQNHNRKMSFSIFLSLVIFFGLQFIFKFISSLLILKFSSAYNPLDTIVKYIFLINILSFTISAFATYLYYRLIEKKLKISEFEKNNEIENLGEK